jgi:RNA 2',3'-cyclic 3'-phosphodiesterase
LERKQISSMSVIRAFIAIELSPEIYARLDEVENQLQKQLDAGVIRWVPPQNIHLTLKFLGDVSLANLEVLKKILESEVGKHTPFEISVGELGAFPSIRRPRVIWVGVQAPPDLGLLQHGIETEMAGLGYAPEDRDFSPHLTLGRVSRNASSPELKNVGDALVTSKVSYLGATRVSDVNLFRSDLKPGGAVYSKLMVALLKTD